VLPPRRISSHSCEVCMNALPHQAKQLFDRFFDQQKQVELEVNAVSQPEACMDPTYYRAIHNLSHEQAIELAEFVDGRKTAEIIKILHQHPFHHEILLQSAFIKHALVKPYGYAGDKDLMLMICRRNDRGATNFAVLKNRVYLDLPAAEAVRQRVNSLYTTLK